MLSLLRQGLCVLLCALLVLGLAPAVSAQSSPRPPQPGAGQPKTSGGAPAPKPASEKELIAVMELEAVGSTKAEAVAMTEQLRSALLNSGKFTLVNREQMDQVSKEVAYQQSGCTSQECAVQLGKQLGARKIVAGRIIKINDKQWLLSGSIIDVETTETVRSESLPYQGDYFTLLTTGIGQLAERLAAGAGPGPAVAKTGSLQVLVNAPDATISINDVVQGSASPDKPLVIPDLPPGPVLFTVQAPGYAQAPGQATIVAGQTASQAVVLRAAKGSLQVNVNVPNVRVFVNGAMQGIASPGQPLVIRDLPPGPLTSFNVDAQGYYSAAPVVTVVAGQTTQEYIALEPVPAAAKPVEEKKSGSSWGWWLLGILLVGGAVAASSSSSPKKSTTADPCASGCGTVSGTW